MQRSRGSALTTNVCTCVKLQEAEPLHQHVVPSACQAEEELDAWVVVVWQRATAKKGAAIHLSSAACTRFLEMGVENSRLTWWNLWRQALRIGWAQSRWKKCDTTATAN